jgi:4-amino-4-deoxy-L-arabinose transferase-like glycosyltransferase
LARAPFPLLGIVLGVAVFRWATALYGPHAGLLALWLVAFNPALVGWAGVALHDFGFACFATTVLYLIWRLVERATLLRLVAGGVMLGLAIVTKFTALSLAPTVLLLGLADAFVRGRGVSRLTSILGRLAAMAVVLVIAGLVAWADYGLVLEHTPVRDLVRLMAQLFPGNAIAAAALDFAPWLPDHVTLPSAVPRYLTALVWETALTRQHSGEWSS